MIFERFNCEIFSRMICLDNQLIQTISQTQNRAAQDKKISAVDIQSLWTPLTQLGEQLTLALVYDRSSHCSPKNKPFVFFLEILQSTATRLISTT